MNSNQRFVIRRCFEMGYSYVTAAILSGCSVDIVMTLYERMAVKAGKSAG